MVFETEKKYTIIKVNSEAYAFNTMAGKPFAFDHKTFLS